MCDKDINHVCDKDINHVCDKDINHVCDKDINHVCDKDINHVCVIRISILPLFLRFLYRILELCDIFLLFRLFIILNN